MKTLIKVMAILLIHSTAIAGISVKDSKFIDEQGAELVLRGWNISAKIPPYKSVVKPEDLDTLQTWGANVIRLSFIWEAFEEKPDQYNWEYLEYISNIVSWAQDRGIHTIIDMHQDAYSRYVLGGCGEGFPKWAVFGKLQKPLNDETCRDWGVRMFDDYVADGPMQSEWRNFYSNKVTPTSLGKGPRDHFIEMMIILGEHFAESGVIGFDILNEPFGTYDEIYTFYADVSRGIHKVFPEALILASPHALTSGSLLSVGFGHKPKIKNMVFSPHYYDPAMMVYERYNGHPGDIGDNPKAGVLGGLASQALRYKDLRSALAGLSKLGGEAIMVRTPDQAVRDLYQQAREWNVPLFIGEFGSPREALGLEFFLDQFYGEMNRSLASGAQWLYAPQWTEKDKDGWNAEDLSSVDDKGQARRTYRPAPFPRRIAGVHLSSEFMRNQQDQHLSETKIELTWEHLPEKGFTEIYVPRLFEDLGLEEQIHMEHSPFLSYEVKEKLGLIRFSSDTEGEAKVSVRYRKLPEDACVILFKQVEGFQCSDGVTYTVDGLDANGQKKHFSQRANYRGEAVQLGAWQLGSSIKISAKRTVLWNKNWTNKMEMVIPVTEELCRKELVLKGQGNCFGSQWEYSVGQ